MFKFVLLLLAFAVVARAGAPASKSLGASIKDAAVEGLEGINLNIGFPFKIDEYIVGVKHQLTSNILRAPDTIFVKRSLNAADGVATIDADFNTKNNVISVASEWVSNKLGATFRLNGNSNDKVTEVGVAHKRNVQGNDVNIAANYNLLDKSVNVDSSIKRQDTTVSVSYDSADQNTEVKVSHDLDSRNAVAPSINLKTQAMKVGWTRRYNGGSIDTTVDPKSKVVSVDWSDKSSNGAWKTSANVHMDDLKKTRVTVARDWDL